MAGKDPVNDLDELLRRIDGAVVESLRGGWLTDMLEVWVEGVLMKRLKYLRDLVAELRDSMQRRREALGCNGEKREGDADGNRPPDDELPDFYVVDLGDGVKNVTRSRLQVLSASGGRRLPPLTRRDLYKGRWEAAVCEYAHSFMCGGFPIGDDPDRPSKDEWLDMPPYPFEVDQFLSEKLFGEGRK